MNGMVTQIAYHCAEMRYGEILVRSDVGNSGLVYRPPKTDIIIIRNRKLTWEIAGNNT